MEAEIMQNADNIEVRHKSTKMLLWVGCISISMMFAGLTSGYIVRRGTGSWLTFQMPFPFYISTAIILLSSITINMALQSAKKGISAALSRYILITFLLGVAFGICQFMGYKELVKDGIYAMGSSSNASGSYLYILTFLHLAHILGGMVALGIAFVKSLRHKYSAQNYHGIKLCTTYWHFVDGLWVYLFIFMLMFR